MKRELQKLMQLPVPVLSWKDQTQTGSPLLQSVALAARLPAADGIPHSPDLEPPQGGMPPVSRSQASFPPDSPASGSHGQQDPGDARFHPEDAFFAPALPYGQQAPGFFAAPVWSASWK